MGWNEMAMVSEVVGALAVVISLMCVAGYHQPDGQAAVGRKPHSGRNNTG
jgi:hypothetical protein